MLNMVVDGWVRRRLSQGIKQRDWEEVPQLDPPAVLANVVLVLVGPKNPANVGTIARSCSAFECLQMRIVESRCIHTARWVAAALRWTPPASTSQHVLRATHACNPCNACFRCVAAANTSVPRHM